MMTSPTELRDKLIIEKLDMEDTRYLQDGFLALIEEANENDQTCNISLAVDESGDSKPNTPFIPISQYETSTDWINNNLNKIEKCVNYKSLDVKHIILPPNYVTDVASLFQGLLDHGVDKEDIHYLKTSFQQLLLYDSSKHNWIRGITWDNHPPTSIDSKDNGEHYTLKTGSARTEGYFKIDILSRSPKRNRRKDIIPLSTNLDEPIHSRVTPYSRKYRSNKKELSRDVRNDQRRLSTAYESITSSDLLKLNQLKFRKKKLRLGKSEIHGLGIFATEPIAPNEIIIEYVGQMIRPIIADLRENKYKLSGIGSYCFRVDDNTIIDATNLGNLNRYINHSCSPNSYAKIMIINNQKKIVIYSKKFIKPDEEITYDYKMSYEDEKIECHCRAPGCRKYLN